MVTALRADSLPDKDVLAGRLRAALAKKQGVLNLPYLFRAADPKINPRLSHMLWAAVLLEDGPAVEQVLAMAHAEAAERSSGGEPADPDTLVTDWLRRLLLLPAGRRTRAILRARIRGCALLRRFQLPECN